MDSSELSVYGEEEPSAYRGLVGSTCYHPLLLSLALAWAVAASSSGGAVSAWRGVAIQAASFEAPKLSERLVQEYEKEAGLGTTPELQRISAYIASIGARVAGALPSPPKYHFILDPNPVFKSAFALPGGNIVVGGGLLALVRTEDELANVLAHEIEHVELKQVSARVAALAKQKSEDNIHVDDFFPGYTKQQELACDLNGQKLAARAGYSPAGMLTLLETFKALRKGEPEVPSDARPTLSERIAQAQPLAKARAQQQTPLRIP